MIDKDNGSLVLEAVKAECSNGKNIESTLRVLEALESAEKTIGPRSRLKTWCNLLCCRAHLNIQIGRAAIARAILEPHVKKDGLLEGEAEPQRIYARALMHDEQFTAVANHLRPVLQSGAPLARNAELHVVYAQALTCLKATQETIEWFEPLVGKGGIFSANPGVQKLFICALLESEDVKKAHSHMDAFIAVHPGPAKNHGIIKMRDRVLGHTRKPQRNRYAWGKDKPVSIGQATGQCQP